MNLNSDTINLQTALEELEIYELTKLDNEYIKKQYHKMALKWHPDKNNNENATIKFQKINAAYDFLSNELKFINDEDISNASEPFVSSSSSKESKIYINVLGTFISSILKGTYNELLIDLVKEIVVLGYNNLSTTYLKNMFETIDKQHAIDLYQLLYKYKDILYIDNNTLELVSLVIKEKYKNDMVFILKPTMYDLMEHNVYKLYIDDKLYLVPLWHNELYFDAPDGSEIIVLCQPKLPDKLTIDENNNIYYEKYIYIDSQLKHLLSSNFVSLDIGGKWFTIPLNKLYIKKEQLYRFKGQGIAQIMENDIYNVSCKSDIIVKIILI